MRPLFEALSRQHARTVERAAALREWWASVGGRRGGRSGNQIATPGREAVRPRAGRSDSDAKLDRRDNERCAVRRQVNWMVAERLQSSRQAARRSGAKATRCWPEGPTSSRRVRHDGEGVRGMGMRSDGKRAGRPATPSGAAAVRCWPVRADEPWRTRLRLSTDVSQSGDATARGRQAASRAEQCDAKLARRDNKRSLR